MEIIAFAADEEQFNLIDVCGDRSGNEIVLRQEGYIESLNYPQVRTNTTISKTHQRVPNIVTNHMYTAAV
jgi:hypothetical protein